MNTEHQRFAGNVALVTGGASGIGAAVVLRLVDEGCKAVVVADLDEAGAAKVAGSSATVRPHRVDVSLPADVDRVVDQTVADHGRLDVVVHAAGIDDPESKAAIDRSREAGESPSTYFGLSVTRPGDGSCRSTSTARSMCFVPPPASWCPEAPGRSSR
jgi:NAD(P)-dependent dehydrogenase (short-subunit alcohol dehydrogenase family)